MQEIKIQEIRKKLKPKSKITKSDLWNHPIGDLYEMMEREGLIPLSGDSTYVIPSIVLYINRLLYEMLNNGGCNYMEEFEKWSDYIADACKIPSECFWLRISNAIGELTADYLVIKDDERKSTKQETFAKIIENEMNELNLELLFNVGYETFYNFDELIFNYSPYDIWCIVSAITNRILKFYDKRKEYTHKPLY